MRCAACGHDITIPNAVSCPNCGQPLPGSTPATAQYPAAPSPTEPPAVQYVAPPNPMVPPAGTGPYSQPMMPPAVPGYYSQPLVPPTPM